MVCPDIFLYSSAYSKKKPFIQNNVRHWNCTCDFRQQTYSMTHYMTRHKSSSVTVLCIHRSSSTVKVSFTLSLEGFQNLLITSHLTISSLHQDIFNTHSFQHHIAKKSCNSAGIFSQHCFYTVCFSPVDKQHRVHILKQKRTISYIKSGTVKE